MRAAALAGKIQREQQFMMGFDADKLYPEVTHGDMVLVQGIIDAWFWEDDEIVLVDYKTDRSETISGSWQTNTGSSWSIMRRHWSV